MRKYSWYLLLIPFFFFIAKIYYTHIISFGCFDDCFNYMGGYFLLNGKHIYSQFFYNHQPSMAYISFVIQKFLHPQSLYTLLVYHRVFVLLWGFGWEVLLIARFRKVGVGFAIVYETTKFYIFGDRFLAEALIVYPLVYLFGLVWYAWEERKIYKGEILGSSIVTWFIIFSREPYVPLVLLLFCLLVYLQRKQKISYVSCGILFLLSAITLLTFPLKDYIFNVFTINQKTVGVSEAATESILGIGGLKVLFYPFWILVSKEWNVFRMFLIIISVNFILYFSIFFIALQKRKEACMILCILFLAHIRFVVPGSIFYAAFHEIEWYGLSIIVTLFLGYYAFFTFSKKIVYMSLFLSSVLFVTIFASPSYFGWEKINRQQELVTNFGEILSNGSVLQILAKSNQTLFLDGNDDMIYWQSHMLSPYAYSWYTSVMPRFPLYTQARLTMFAKNPPDFYYGYCTRDTFAIKSLPASLQDAYTPFYFANRPTCLTVKKTTLSSLAKSKLLLVRQLYGYYIPSQK